MKTKIYLAGGMHSNWRKKITSKIPEESVVFDPSNNDFKNEDGYTIWDLSAIDACDILFAYMDNDNPSGYGLNLEVGYAKAKNKIIIMLDELTDDRRKYFGMVRSCANIVVSNLDDAISVLTQFILLLNKF